MKGPFAVSRVRIVDENGRIVGPTNLPNLQFDTASTPVANAEGLLQWNATDGTLDLGMSNGDITIQLGQEMFAKVRNDAGATITNGSVVYISGRTGVYPDVKLARSDAEVTSHIIGIATQDILNTGSKFGFVTTMGYVRGIKTNYSGAGNWGTTWLTGDKLYVSKTVAGQLTNVEPTAPHHSDTIGEVGVVSANGSIFVMITAHKTLAELTDVDGTALTTEGQLPVWNQSTQVFDFNYNFYRQKVAIKSGDYTLALTDQVVVFTASATATLPAATGSGQTYRIVCRAGTLIIDGDSTDTIKGEPTQVLTAVEDLIITDTTSGIWE